MAEVSLTGFRCERCEHRWAPRKKGVPKVCPKCKSPYWNSPRQRKVGARAAAKRESG